MMTPQQLVAEARNQIREVNVTEAAYLLNEGALCLDVRKVGEFEVERLPDAINIPRGVLELRIGDLPRFVDKSNTVLVYCKTGGRAALASCNLQRMGYSSVMSIEGGIDAWRSQGMPLIKDNSRYGVETTP